MGPERWSISHIIRSLSSLSAAFLSLQAHKAGLLKAINNKSYREIVLYNHELLEKLPKSLHIYKELEASLSLTAAYADQALALAKRYRERYPSGTYKNLGHLLNALKKAREDLGRKKIFRNSSIHGLNRVLLKFLQHHDFGKAKGIIEREERMLQEMGDDIKEIIPLAESMAKARGKEASFIGMLRKKGSVIEGIAAAILLSFSAMYLSMGSAHASTAELDNKLVEWDQSHIGFANTPGPSEKEIADYRKKTFGLLDSLLECLAFEEMEKDSARAKATREHITHILKVTKIPENIAWKRLEIKKKALEKKLEDERIRREQEEKEIAAMEKESEKKQQEDAKKNSVREFTLDLSIDGKPIRITFTSFKSTITGDAPEAKKQKIVDAINRTKGIDSKQKDKAIALLESQWEMEKEF